jgi:hypothetical protein
MAKYTDIVGWLWIGYGVFQLVIAVLLGLAMFGFGGLMGAAGMSGGDDELAVVGGIYALIGPVVAILVGGFAVLDIAAGIGIRRRTSWGRILGFVVAVLSLSSIPIGLAMGIFTFVVLLDAEAAAEFGRPVEA